MDDLLGVAAEAVGAARRALSGLSDVERAVARLAAGSVAGGIGREAPNVVLYEDGSRRRIRPLSASIRDLQVGDGRGGG